VEGVPLRDDVKGMEAMALAVIVCVLPVGARVCVDGADRVFLLGCLLRRPGTSMFIDTVVVATGRQSSIGD